MTITAVQPTATEQATDEKVSTLQAKITAALTSPNLGKCFSVVVATKVCFVTPPVAGRPQSMSATYAPIQQWFVSKNGDIFVTKTGNLSRITRDVDTHRIIRKVVAIDDEWVLRRFDAIITGLDAIIERAK